MARILKVSFCTIAAALCLVALPAQAGSGAHWSYGGSDGPEHWGDLAPEYVQCKVGVNQSPVDITRSVEAELPALRLNYSGATTEVINNGHTAQVNVEPGNTLRVDGDVFELLQFHLHAPSEHLINGKPFLMELHLVHSNSRGELAVIGVVYDAGESNPKLAEFHEKIPETVNKPVALQLSLADLGLPAELRDYYRYNGSLTTPPCSEGVRWFVLSQPRTISPRRQEAFIDLIGKDARGPQALNARVILR